MGINHPQFQISLGVVIQYGSTCITWAVGERKTIILQDFPPPDGASTEKHIATMHVFQVEHHAKEWPGTGNTIMGANYSVMLMNIVNHS